MREKLISDLKTSKTHVRTTAIESWQNIIKGFGCVQRCGPTWQTLGDMENLCKRESVKFHAFQLVTNCCFAPTYTR